MVSQGTQSQNISPRKIKATNEKYNNLLAALKCLKHAAVAFSGGVDSSFLLAAAKEALGDKAVGITIDSPALPRYELEDAIAIARLVGARHIIVQSDEIESEVKQNPVNRCYFCKKAEFGSIIEKAKSLGIRHVLDGSNADDLMDYRPGMNAIKELKVVSPLLEAGLTKAEIRDLSRELNLPTWDKPAYACLYSRIPYGQEIKLEDLRKVEKGEKFFIDRGFRTVRVRCHGELARIEVAVADRIKLLCEPLASEITQTLKSFGFKFVTLDIQGYRMGSFNETIDPAKSKCGGENHG
ncbi:MAG: ATP-dependent sacrificial sulfur transferase LarE [Deltaproteobacteria bacterium]